MSFPEHMSTVPETEMPENSSVRDTIDIIDTRWKRDESADLSVRDTIDIIDTRLEPDEEVLAANMDGSMIDVDKRRGADLTDHSADTTDADKRVKNSENKEIEDEKVDTTDPLLNEIEKKIGTAEGLAELAENHPEKQELWDKLRDALDTINNPDASPAEIKSAQGKISSIKGQILEIAAKDGLSEAGLDVEGAQRTIKGESGDTKPDIIAHNNTDKPIEVFGITIQPGESISVECKCGSQGYLNSQLENHIPNQLSGHEGASVLLTTSDIKETTPGLAAQVCEKYGTKLVAPDVSVKQVDHAIKEVFSK